MPRILVTGGAGFIGSHIVEQALLAGHSVRVLDNLSTGRRHNLAPFGNRVELIEGNILDVDAVGRAMQGVDWVAHQAALISVPASMSDPTGYTRTNVEGTVNVLRAAAQAGVKHLTFASSCAVYGDATDLPIREETATAPLSPYAASKLCGEVFLQNYAIMSGMQTTAFRYFNVFGPRQDPSSEYAAVIPKFIARMRGGQAPIIFGDGEQSRDFIFVADVARANLRAMQRESGGFRVFNLGNGVSHSLLDLVSDLNAVLGTSFAPRHDPPRAGDIKHSSANVDRIANELGFRPSVSWRDGLAQTAA